MWLFGYGSLIWKVDFPYTRKQIGCIKGFERRFYQYSTDHRGTDENPGRVVTLLKSNNPEQEVWGIAYEIDDSENGDGGRAAAAIWNQLDFRERNGYTRKLCTFYPKSDAAQPFDLVVYISDPDNEWYAGEAPIAEIARSIISAKGKSGYNIDYLWQLARWMRTVVPEADDPHLFELETETRQLVSQSDKLGNDSVGLSNFS